MVILSGALRFACETLRGVEGPRMTIVWWRMATTEKAVLARRFLVRGRVQGVGFRWFVEREAHILGIAGWVRNNADSSVEVLAMGTHDQLVGLRSRLREGPRAARVDDVEESEAKPVSGLTTFRIEGAW
jgi:acylphosphatase